MTQTMTQHTPHNCLSSWLSGTRLSGRL
jgi:hypothetical protein